MPISTFVRASVAALCLATIAGCHHADQGTADLGSDDASDDLGGDGDLGSPDLQLPPMRPIGLDMPDLLRAYLGDSATTPAEARQQMMLARARGFTYARIEGCAFWPSEMTSATGWQAHPDAFFAAFDALVADARAAGLRLVPTLLWNNYLFPDLAGEPRSKLFTPGSASRTLAERYITDVVTRYKDSDVILFWELANELNLEVDLDYAGCTTCNIAASLGTPTQRTADDDFYSCNDCRGVSTTQQDLGAFVGALAQLIHSIDPGHEISSGYSILRPSAYHLAYSPCPACDWTTDTEGQYQSLLTRLHPAGVDIVSLHLYLNGTELARFGDWDLTGAPLLATTQAIASAAGKQLYVGEYGEMLAGSTTCGPTTCGGDAQKAFTVRVLDALTANEVPYSGIWAFEWHPFCASAPDCWTVAANAPIVDAMVTHDEAYGSCSGKPDGAACPIGSCHGGRCVAAAGAPTPTALARWTFQAAGDIASWNVSTNCTSCTPGSLAVVGSGASGYAELTTHDLPCSGACTNAGAYALSPTVAVTTGHVTLRASARTSATRLGVRLIAEDASHASLLEQSASADQGAAFGPTGLTIALPAGTADVRVRLDLYAPNATLDVASIALDATQ